MNPVAHIIQVAIVGGFLLAICWVFVMLVRADLRANPARAKLPAPWAGLQAIRDYIAALDCGREDADEDEPADQSDPGADWDRAYDRFVDRQMGAA